MMSARFKKVRVCSCFLFLCFSTSQALADTPDKELAKDDQTPVGDQIEPAPALEYSSVFDVYLSYDDVPDIGWKEANDNVGDIGGWRAYANLVQEEARMKAELEAQEEEAQEEEAQEEAQEEEEKEAKEGEGDQQ